MTEWKEGKSKRPKKRKPMTEEQKQAASERLAKAREAKGPIQYKNVHPSVIALPDEHYLSYKKVKKWIKTQQDLARSYRRDATRKVPGAISKASGASAYVRQMNHYIQHGDWPSDYYGEYEENKVSWKTITEKEW